MRKFFTIALLSASIVSFTAPATAASLDSRIPKIRYKGDKTEMMRQGERFNVVTLPNSARKNSARIEESGSATLTVNLNYDVNEFYLFDVSVIWPDGEEWGFAMGETEVTFENMPATTGLIVVPFTNMGVPDSPSSYYVFKPFSTYDGETTMINVSPDDATETISFPTVLPDGSAPVLPTVTDMESDDYDYSGANVAEVGAYTTIGNDDYGTLFVIGTNQLSQSLDGFHGMQNLDLRISPLDETWHFTQSRWMVSLDDNVYFTHTAINGTSATPAPNSPDFVQFKYDFAVNPIMEAIPNEGGMVQGYGSQYMINGEIDPMTFSFYTYKTYDYYMSAPVTADTDSWSSNYGIQVMNVELDVITESLWGEMEDMRCVYSPLVMYDTDNNSLFFQDLSTIFVGSPLWWNENNSNPQVYPGVMAYSSPTDEAIYPLGGTAPLSVATLEAYDFGDGDLFFYNSMSWLGIYTEARDADGALATAVVKVGDEEFESSFDELNNTLAELAMEGNLSGAFSIEVTNAKNVVVENIPGYNITSLNITNSNSGDPVPPTFTSMQLRNSDGIVCNHFDSAEDGVIYLSGGDFVSAENELTEYWECEPVEIKVECALDGSDEYEEIEMTEVAENYKMPIFGYFWEGSLKDLSSAEDGWYKLRLTMTDAAGNSQQQEIYPAFNIGNSSGIEAVGSDNSNLPVKYYNLQGVEIKNPVAGSIVIRRQGNEVKKVVLK